MIQGQNYIEAFLYSFNGSKGGSRGMCCRIDTLSTFYGSILLLKSTKPKMVINTGFFDPHIELHKAESCSVANFIDNR